MRIWKLFKRWTIWWKSSIVVGTESLLENNYVMSPKNANKDTNDMLKMIDHFNDNCIAENDF